MKNSERLHFFQNIKNKMVKNVGILAAMLATGIIAGSSLDVQAAWTGNEPFPTFEVQENQESSADDATTESQESAQPSPSPSVEPSVAPTPSPTPTPTPTPTPQPTNVDNSFASNPKATILDASSVKFTASLPSIPVSDDGMLYLYQLQVYEYAIPAGAQPIGSVSASTNPEIVFDLNKGQANTRLYSKFVLAIKSGGAIKTLCEPQFVCNPEILATHTHARSTHPLKGIQGVDFMNVPIQSSDVVPPNLLSRVAQILSYGTDMSFVNPYAKVGDSKPVPQSCYMLNANDAAGVNLLINKMEYYAANATKTDDWIVGNEVNVRQWNYMSWQGWDEYMRQYEQVFRIVYIAVKSNNANANVYLCLDQNWDRNRASSHAEYYHYIDGKDFLIQFAADIKRNGDIDWGISQHPYTVPLTWAKFWDMSGCPDGGYCANMINGNKMVSFQNLTTITNFLQQGSMLSPRGAVRHFMISEIGACNAQGEEVQAACICAEYMAAARNPYVENIIYSSSVGVGVDTTFSAAAQDMFNNMDGANGAEYQQRAMNTIGITDWGQVLH